MERDDLDGGRVEGRTSAEHQEPVELHRENRVRDMEVEIPAREATHSHGERSPGR